MFSRIDLVLRFNTHSELATTGLGVELGAMAYDLLQAGRHKKINGHKLLKVGFKGSRASGKSSCARGFYRAFDGVEADSKKNTQRNHGYYNALIEAFLKVNQLEEPLNIRHRDASLYETFSIPFPQDETIKKSEILLIEHSKKDPYWVLDQNSIELKFKWVSDQERAIKMLVPEVSSEEIQIIQQHFPLDKNKKMRAQVCTSSLA